MIYIFLFLSFFSNTKYTDIPSVDLIEYNFSYSEKNEVTFKQIILYSWDESLKNFVVRQWFIVEKDISFKRAGDYYYITLYSRDNRRFITVKTKSFKETKTVKKDDPERKNRKILHENDRIPIFPIY